MLFSREVEVALVALSRFDPEGPSGKGRGGRDLAKESSLPPAFLAKVLQHLAHSGILRSRRGRHGGFLLGRPAKEIAVADVLIAIHGVERPEDVFPPLPAPLETHLGPAREALLQALKTVTVADLGQAPRANETLPKP